MSSFVRLVPKRGRTSTRCSETPGGAGASTTDYQTQVLSALVDALDMATMPKKPPIYDNELYFLTAKVMIENGQLEPAAELLNEALGFPHPRWRIRLLGQLLVCYRRQENEQGCIKVTDQLDVLVGEAGDLDGLYVMAVKKSRPAMSTPFPQRLFRWRRG